MLQFLHLNGQALPAASPAPSIVRTPAGRAMGSIPGWNILLDPGYVTSGRVLERVTGALTDNIDFSQIVGQFPNGAAALVSPTTGDQGRRIQPNRPLSPNAWTIFSVTQLEASGQYQRLISTAESGVTQPSPRIGWLAGGAYMNMWDRENGTELIRYTPPISFRERTALTMVSFSTRDGIRFFENGTLVASAPNYRTPFAAAFGSGEWVLFMGMRGLIGMTGALDIDLGWAEHAGYRRSIERFLMQQYAIV